MCPPQAGFPPSEYALGRTMVFGSAGLEAQFADKARELRERRELENRARKDEQVYRYLCIYIYIYMYIYIYIYYIYTYLYLYPYLGLT